MTLFLAGLIIFLGVHSLSIIAPRWRDAQVERMGAMPWRGVYSVVSIVSLLGLIYGYGLARQAPVVVYAPPVALQHLALLLMVPVFPLLIAAYLPGRIKRLARNPMLLAVVLWAAAHLLANGTLDDVLLFGGFFVWAVADLISVSRRAQVRAVPGAPPSAINDVIVVVVGLGLYAWVLLWAHQRWFGVPLPG